MLKVFALGLFLVSAPLAWAMGNVPSTEQTDSFAGKLAPDFTLATTGGEEKSLTQARAGKKAIIFFWATWCPHCHEEILRLNGAIQGIAAKGIQIILVDLGESKQEVAAYLKHNQVNLDSFVDEDNALQEPYQLVGVPTLIFVDEGGVIRNVNHELPDNYEKLFTAAQ